MTMGSEYLMFCKLTFCSTFKIVTDLLLKNASLLSAMHIFCMLNAVINRCFHITCIQFFTVHSYLNQEQFELLSTVSF